MKTITCFIIFVMLVSTAFAGPVGEEKAKKEENEIKPALVVIDIQNIYLPMMDEKGKDAALWMINEHMKYFRQHG